MNAYLWLKTAHVISATILFGTGLGTAFFKWIVDRSGNVAAIRVVSECVVLADWLFTTPAVIVQPATGFAMVWLAGYPFELHWVVASLVLYLLAGACWLVVLRLQLATRDLARIADRQGTVLPDRYWEYSRQWFWLGVPAFAALVIVFGLMVFKPQW